jgi:hypothetical protein
LKFADRLLALDLELCHDIENTDRLHLVVCDIRRVDETNQGQWICYHDVLWSKRKPALVLKEIMLAACFFPTDKRSQRCCDRSRDFSKLSHRNFSPFVHGHRLALPGRLQKSTYHFRRIVESHWRPEITYTCYCERSSKTKWRK